MVRREKINRSIYFKINFIHFYALWMHLNYNLYKIQVTQLLLQIPVLNFLAFFFHFYLIIDVHPIICLAIVSVTFKCQQLAKNIQSNVTTWKHSPVAIEKSTSFDINGVRFAKENTNGKCGKREKFEWEEGQDGRKLANWLAVVIQFKMDRGRDARIDTQMSRAYEHELADGTRLVSIRIILLSIGPRHPDATEGTRECTEKHTGVVETRGKEAREKKKAGNLAPWIRTHKSSILHVSMAPGNNVRYAIFFPSFFLCVSTLASLFSLFHLCASFFWFRFCDQRHTRYEIKRRQEKERDTNEFHNDAVCVELLRTFGSRIQTYPSPNIEQMEFWEI